MLTSPVAAQATKRLVLNLTPKTMERLQQLANTNNVKVGEIIRQAISIYSYIAKVKAEAPGTRVLLDRGNGEKTELVLPSEVEAEVSSLVTA